MTENDAIKELETSINLAKMCTQNCERKREIQGYEKAIQALETIKKLSDRNMTTEVLENYMQFEDECVKKGFTFKSMIEAREKQIPRKLGIEDSDRGKCCICPSCEGFIGYMIDCKDECYQDNYCPSCGQNLDWSDEEWD